MRPISLALVFPFLVACGGKDTDTEPPPDTQDTGPKPVMNADLAWEDVVPVEGTLWTYRNPVDFMDYSATIGAPEEVDDGTYTPFLIGDHTNIWADRFATYLDFATPWQLGFKMLYYTPTGTEEPQEFYKITPPAVLSLTDVEETPSTSTAMAMLRGGPEVDLTVVTTLVDLDTSVEVPLGVIDHCRQYRADITVGGNEGFSKPITVWFHPDYGMVRTSDSIGGVQWELVAAAK